MVLLGTSATREEARDIADAAYRGTNTAVSLEDQVISKYLHVSERSLDLADFSILIISPCLETWSTGEANWLVGKLCIVKYWQTLILKILANDKFNFNNFIPNQLYKY